MPVELPSQRRAREERERKAREEKAKAAPPPPPRESQWSGEKPRGKQQQKAAPTGKAEDIHRTPPHSVEAEQGVLGSILTDCQYQRRFDVLREVAGSIQPWYFYVPAHKTIYEVMLSLYQAGVMIDLITFTQILSDRNLLLSVGGASFVTNLFTFVPTAANVQWYVEIMRDKFILRETIATGTQIVRAAYGAADDEAADILQDFSVKIERIKRHAGWANGIKPLSPSDLQAMKGQLDPNNLVGWRWQCRGGNCLWSGGAGYGKSTLIAQFATQWAVGERCFGIKPIRALKSLIVQSENDDFDVAEQYNGVLAGANVTDDDREKIEANVIFIRVEAKSGRAFLIELERLLSLHMPDLVWIDPLFAFAGCDLMNAEKTGYFLREGLFPLFVKFRCSGNIIHHIAKPPKEERADKPTIDYQYAAFGSSEIQNAFRAVVSLHPISFVDQIYKLVLSKRGRRARAKNLEGHPTSQLWIQQSEDPGTIFWTQVEEPEKPTKKAAQKFSDSDIMEHLSILTGIKTAKLLKKVREEEGIPPATFYRMWKDLKKRKLVKEVDGEWFRTSQAEQSESEQQEAE